MNNKNRDVWIGVIALVVIGGLGIWWLMSNDNSASMTNTVATSTTATTTTTTTANKNTAQGPQTVDRSSQNVVSIAENISGASDFASWLSSTGVAATLKGAGPYTIFVPTDGSISQLPAGTISKLTAAGKKRLVQYHIVTGRAIDVTAENSGSIQALSGDALNFSYNATNIPMVDSAITITEYKGSNGVVYLIDNVLIPPTSTQQQL
jgi:uncharacterized surface protein with fasciclin (FAS1) repeats